ncbi:MAG TPA: hypothetical protein PLG09_10090 [Syntrophomonadaceae bacterium]|nr:hypothetical protein [Syntrophomonadaceae bacterium]HOQ10461.1 hypothetical protein [Syntrophomonadaceae bacterium]HPU49622.1 hypothetical protein [Syntrophomonadaceae bacterium]
MSQESEKTSKGQPEGKPKESADYYCYQFGSEFCKKQCPNDCYQRFQEKINKMFGNLMESGKQ